MTHSFAKREALFGRWWEMTPSERKIAGLPVTLEEFGKKHFIDIKRLGGWNDHLNATRTKVDDDYREYIAHMKIVAYAPDSSPQDRRTYAQLKGWLKEPQDDTKKYEFSSEDRLRISTEILAGIREGYLRDGGVCPVCGQSALLPDKICLDTEQDNRQESKVGAVAVPA